MLRTICYFYLSFIPAFLFAQSNVVNDTTSAITLRFNKVKPCTEEFDSAEMNIRYLKNTDTVLLEFVVANDISRYKTTFSDYVILETPTEKVQLQNIKESDVSEGSIYFAYWHYKNYTFSCTIPRENFVKLVAEGLLKATFYFTPNEGFIREQLAKEKLLEKSFVSLFEKRASKTLNYSASEPDKAKYEVLRSWLSKLK